MTKKTAILLLSLFIAAVAQAGDFDYLVIEDQQSATTVFVSDGLTLTYDDAALTVQPVAGDSQTFQLSALKKMFFSNSSATGIESLNATASGAVDAYDMGGRFCGRFNSLSEAVSQLSKGVYVMKSQVKTFKVMVQ